MSRPALADADEYRPDFVGDGHDDVILLRYDEVGELLRVPPKQVYDLPIPQVRLSERRVRWRLSDVRDYIEGRAG